MNETPWTKATRSSGSGQCVEMRRTVNGAIQVRDSKDPSGPVLSFTPGELDAFLDGVRKGEFDHLLDA